MDVLYLAGHDFYDFVWFRPQHIATRLSRKHRVLYVQPTRAMKWQRPLQWNRVMKHNDNLHILNPAVMPGIRYSRVLRKLNQRILGRNITMLLNRLGMKVDVCIISTPFMGEFAKRFGEKVTVYDCNDDWSSIPGLPTDFLVREERKLMGSADLVFVTSRELHKKKRAYNSNTFLLPSGTDVEHFSICIEEQLNVPEDISALPRPIIGSIGSLNNTKDDLELLNHIADARPQWSLVIIGPVMQDVNLDQYPALRKRAHFLGKKDYSELPQYLSALDVCVLAYKRNEFTQCVNPTKVFEYLSAGRPVVATPLDDILHLSPLVSFADDYDGFIKAIENSLSENGDRRKEQMRVEASKRFSWESIVGEMEKQICGCIAV